MTAPDADRDAEHDIAKVLVRYASGIDRRDWDLLRSCFTPDCHCDYEGVGVWDSADAVVDFMAASHADVGHTMHRVSNLDVTVTGDTATARAYVDAVLMAPDGQSGLNAVGFYDDELVRTPDGWRISTRHFTPVRFGVV